MCALLGSIASVGSGGRDGVLRQELLDRLREPGRVVLLCAPAGSGKTALLRSWIGQANVADGVACISVDREERDPQRFWISVLDALRSTAAGSTLVGELTAAPDLDGWAIVERMLEDLSSLEGRMWLVIDNLHELRSDEALRQLELLLMRAPEELRFVLSTRHDLRLGLHRFRLSGELTEIRADALRFTEDEARALLESAGVELPDPVLERLLDRTEGWAAGLRLAALSLTEHPDPERFASEFSGSERTVAEYLLAEVLERQPEQVRRLLVRTSILDRVNGPLADLLTGASGGERILFDLERANAFVVSLNGDYSWFRYRRLFADLLAQELRRTEPEALPALHGLAATWYAKHGDPIEAINHAQAAEDWDLAARLLCDHALGLRLDGHSAAVHQLLAAFPAHIAGTHPELLALRAVGELDGGTLEEAERQLGLAAQEAGSVPEDRRERFHLQLATRRLRVARRRGNLPTVVQEAQRLLAPAESADAAQLGIGEEQRAIALIELGIAELWSARCEHMDRHFEQGIALAQRIERPYLEINGLAHWAMAAGIASSELAAERSMQAIELARRHGWSEEPIVAAAHLTLGTINVWRGRLAEAEAWLERAEHTLRAEVEPAAGTILQQDRALLELARGRHENALVAFDAAERQAKLLVGSHPLAMRLQAHRLRALIRAGQIERAESGLAEMDEPERSTGEMRTTLAALRLAQDHPEAAITAIAPVLDGSVPVPTRHVWLVLAHLLDAIARDALNDSAAAGQALERALDLAEPDGTLLPFLLHPVPALLAHHRRHHTAHAALVSDICDLLGGRAPAARPGGAQPLREALSGSEIRVLRYLPTNLAGHEIANELYVTVHTVRTHLKHIYAKLGVHSRAEAVARARALGLLAPTGRIR